MPVLARIRVALTTALVLATGALPGCVAQGPAPASDAATTVWRLARLDGAPYPASASLVIEPGGRAIHGEAPCNAYRARQSATAPAFAPGPITATRRACLQIEGEAAFFAALASMTQQRIAAGRLILGDAGGDRMIFTPAPD